jgi:hypothetical protein
LPRRRSGDGLSKLCRSEGRIVQEIGNISELERLDINDIFFVIEKPRIELLDGESDIGVDMTQPSYNLLENGMQMAQREQLLDPLLQPLIVESVCAEIVEIGRIGKDSAVKESESDGEGFCYFEMASRLMESKVKIDHFFGG